MKTHLTVPKLVKAGFNKRDDTYTGKLAYVIYQDEKGVWRKQQSWEGWIEKKMGVQEFQNEPTSGFVLNKTVGGPRQSYGWNPRNEKARVYDPRGFEFEMSFANLLFVLQECTSTKGKGLEGEFVYAWDGKDLVLLPVDSHEYKTSVEFTGLKKKNVKAKDMVPGCLYQTKQLQQVMYMGKHDFLMPYAEGFANKHVFHIIDAKPTEEEEEYDYYGTFRPREFDEYLVSDGLKDIAVKLTDAPSDGYADAFETMKNKHVVLAKAIAWKTSPVVPKPIDISQITEDNCGEDFCDFNSDKENSFYYIPTNGHLHKAELNVHRDYYNKTNMQIMLSKVKVGISDKGVLTIKESYIHSTPFEPEFFNNLVKDAVQIELEFSNGQKRIKKQ